MYNVTIPPEQLSLLDLCQYDTTTYLAVLDVSILGHHLSDACQLHLASYDVNQLVSKYASCSISGLAAVKFSVKCILLLTEDLWYPLPVQSSGLYSVSYLEIKISIPRHSGPSRCRCPPAITSFCSHSLKLQVINFIPPSFKSSFLQNSSLLISAT